MNKKSLIYNYLYNLIKTLSGIIFPIITFSYSSRILGVEGLGKINFAKAVVTYFSILAMLGINQYGTREAAKVRDNRRMLSKFVHEVLIINMLTTVLSLFLLSISIVLIDKFQDYTLLILVNSVTIVMMGMGMEWLYQAIEEYSYITKRTLCFQCIALIAMFLFVKNSQDIIIYAIISVMASSGSYILNFIYARKFIDFQYYGRYEIKKHLPPMLWLFAMAASTEIYTVLDSTMLGFLCDDSSVGLYNAAIKVNRMIIALISALGVVLIPRLSFYIGQGDKSRFQDLINKGYNYMFMVSIPSAMGLFVLSDDIIELFCGSEYSSAGFTMRIMTWVVIVIPFSVMTNNQTFVPMGLEKLIIKSTCIGAITNFISNFILIPQMAENGAALGTVIAETAVAIVCLNNALRILDMKLVFQGFYQYLIAAFPIIPISRFLKGIHFNYIFEIIIVIFVSMTVYVALLFLQKNVYLENIIRKVKSRM